MKNKTSHYVLMALLAFTTFMGASSLSQAQVQIDHTDTFTGNTGTNFSIAFTAIGNAGNAADTTGYGAVGYNYNIGTYDISQSQIDAAGIPNVTGAGAWSNNQPAADISWYQAAAFVNFLDTNSGSPITYNLTSVNADGTGSMNLWTNGQAGYNAADPFRNSLATYFLPTENEWYKAAYGKSDGSGYYAYTTASNTAPTAVASGTNAGTAVYHQSFSQGPADVTKAGGASAYGTMGQGGNVYQWEESPYTAGDTNPAGARGYRSGYWANTSGALLSSYRNGDDPSRQGYLLGFRVASVANAVPEPSSFVLFGLGALALIVAARRKLRA